MHVNSAFQLPPGISHLQLGEVTDILQVFSNYLCYNTQPMRKFQVLFFLLKLRFLKWPQDLFGKFVDPSYRVYM